MVTAPLSSFLAHRVSPGSWELWCGVGRCQGLGLTLLSRPLLHVVAQRCFPAIHAHKGVLMVGNATTYEDGDGVRKNITELVEGAK